ncbi:MAG: hypothetical protein ACRC10_09290 [Thermoguttaceae bacterium]
MLRHVVFALSLFLLLIGGQLFFVESATIYYYDLQGKKQTYSFQVEKFLPYSFLSVGAVLFCLGFRVKM